MALHQLFFYLTILLLPTQLGLHFWPDWALVLGRRIDYLSPTLYLTDITIIITLLLWISFPQKNIQKKTILFICLFVGFVIVNISISLSPFVALYTWIKVIEFACFGYYIAQTKPSFQKILFVLTVAMTYSSIIAIAQFILQHSIGGIFWYLGERSFDIATAGIARVDWCWFTTTRCMELLRPYATFPHPNVLGGFLAIVLTLLIMQSKYKKTFYLTAIFIGIIALMLTFSRSAWILGSVGIFCACMFSKKIKNWTMLIAGIVIITGFFIALPYMRTLTYDSESIRIRTDLAQAAWTMWKSYPLIGVGLGNFVIHHPTQPVHNIYLLILSETGLIGLGFFIIFLIKIFKKNNVFIIYHLSFIILLLLGLVDHYPLTLQQGQLLTTIVLTLGFLSKK